MSASSFCCWIPGPPGVPMVGVVGKAGKRGYLERSCDSCLPTGMEIFLYFRDDMASLCVPVKADTVGFPSGASKWSKASLPQIIFFQPPREEMPCFLVPLENAVVNSFYFICVPFELFILFPPITKFNLHPPLQ